MVFENVTCQCYPYYYHYLEYLSRIQKRQICEYKKFTTVINASPDCPDSGSRFKKKS